MKEQGSAALRIVAFAVALAVVLGLSSVMFQLTASAEASSSESDISTATDYDKDISVGTLKNYSCLQLGYSSEIDYLHLRNLYYASSSPYMFYTLFGVDSSGHLVHLTSNIGLKFTSNDYIGYQYANIQDTYYLNKLYKFKLGFSVYPADSSFMCFNMYKSNFDSDIFNTYVTYAIFDKSLYSKFYLVYTGSSDNSNAALTSFVSDVSSNINGSDFKDSSDSSLPHAEFLSFKGTESSGLYLVDWVQAGQQYPIVDFRIDDKGNHHKYALRISGNSNYAEILKGIWDRQEVKESISAASNGFGILLLLKAAAGIGKNFAVTIAGASTPIGALFLNVPNHDMSGYVMLAAQNKLVKEYDSLTYDDIRTLSSDGMNFSEGSSSVSKAVSLCLSDYVSVVPNTLYKLEIIDVTESKLLDVAYFSSRRGYQKSDSGYGTNITDYDNSADLDNDIDNNNGYTGGSSSNGGKLDTDNPNDIIDTNYNNSLANINISDIIVSLRTSIASVGVFFQSCWALFPPAIWSIILLGLSLIVVLRLLGR